MEFFLIYFFQVYNFVKLAELGMDITGPTKSPKASEREFLKLISVLKILSFCFFLVLPFVAFFQGNNNNKAVLFQSTSQFLPMIDEVHFLFFFFYLNANL